MRNMNRVSNSCKICLTGYDFYWRSYVFGVVFHGKISVCKRYDFWKSLRTESSLTKFCDV